jgi:putative transcriptional regulator
MSEDPHGDAAAHALGALDPREARAWEEHSATCLECGRTRASLADVPAKLGAAAGAVAPSGSVREQLLDLAEVSRLSLDIESYEWDEVAPGVSVHLVREDPERGLRSYLVWGRAGARHPRHRHLGDEVILVLRGRIRDERGSYGPGEVCRSETGFVHTEQAEAGEDCLCYVLYYGPLEMLPEEG